MFCVCRKVQKSIFANFYLPTMNSIEKLFYTKHQNPKNILFFPCFLLLFVNRVGINMDFNLYPSVLCQPITLCCLSVCIKHHLMCICDPLSTYPKNCSRAFLFKQFNHKPAHACYNQQHN